MKSKHAATYGEKAAHSGFYNSHLNDTVSHKSTIAALCYRSAIVK